MMKMLKRAIPMASLLTTLFVLCLPALASPDAIYRQAIREIICPCPSCGGQTIDQCHPGCEDGGELRGLVKADAGKGQSEQQILTALVADRGERILGNPRAQGFGILAAAVPALALLLGLLPMGLVLRARSRRSEMLTMPPAPTTSPASEEDPRVAEALREVDF